MVQSPYAIAPHLVLWFNPMGVQSMFRTMFFPVCWLYKLSKSTCFFLSSMSTSFWQDFGYAPMLVFTTEWRSLILASRIPSPLEFARGHLYPKELCVGTYVRVDEAGCCLHPLLRTVIASRLYTYHTIHYFSLVAFEWSNWAHVASGKCRTLWRWKNDQNLREISKGLATKD